MEEAHPEAAPANVLRVETWLFTLSHATPHTSTAAALWEEADAHTLELMTRAQREGFLARNADLEWRGQVY